MKFSMPAAFGLLIAAGTVLGGCGGNDDDAARRAKLGLPAPGYVADSQRGGQLFGEFCRACHGPAARGTDKGPPLIHPYYVASHHADYAFYMAVRNGVRQHHWEFGDMPPQPQLAPHQAADITAYVRAIQKRQGMQ